jgi:spore maturation protein CgeB
MNGHSMSADTATASPHEPKGPEKGSTTPLDIVIFGLSITSAWGNGHATTYRSLVRALAQRGHRITFFERDKAWYAQHRDLPSPPWCDTRLYASLDELQQQFSTGITADLVIVGSYVPDGASLARWVLERAQCPVAFYDIDTPVTLASLAQGRCSYLSRELVPLFDLYLSFTGGPLLAQLRSLYGARRVQPLYCSVDTGLYHPADVPPIYDLAYLGTYSEDRQPSLERLLIEPARRWPEGRFCVAGAQYPQDIEWPGNIIRIEHVSPREHCRFYNSQRFALNLTRADMRAAGYSPSVRLFEAAACGVPIITDRWPGLEHFFEPGMDILVAESGVQVLHYLCELDHTDACVIGIRGRGRVLGNHTAAHRAAQLESYVHEIRHPGLERPSPAMTREALHGT